MRTVRRCLAVLVRAIDEIVSAILFEYESPYDRLSLEQQKDMHWKGGVGR